MYHTVDTTCGLFLSQITTTSSAPYCNSLQAKANMEGEGANPYSVASGRLPYSPLTMRHQLVFLHHCLLFHANCDGASDGTDLHRPLEGSQVVDLRWYLVALCGDDVGVFNQYLAFIKYALSPGAGVYMYMYSVCSIGHRSV